jgi:hypothetical protein
MVGIARARAYAASTPISPVGGPILVSVVIRSTRAARPPIAVEHRSLLHLDQSNQLATHLGDVGAVNFIDEQRVAPARIGMRLVAHLFEVAIDQPELRAPVV